MTRRTRILAALLLAAVLAALGAPGGERHAAACAFDPWRPDAYEGDQQRARYNAAIEAASVNRLLPSDSFFALPAIERGPRTARSQGAPFIPSTLLKAIAWVESTMTQAARAVSFDSVGPAQISFDCGHGIMQVTTGMTTPLGADGTPSARQASIATHYAYNIARGAQILAEKWNAAPEQIPVAGIDTASDPAIVENWYFATWAYNGFTGPGSSISNHPADPQFGSWPRPAYTCDGTQARNRYPYQELVWGCMARPDQRNGQLLWQPLAATLPNLTNAVVARALSVANWTYPYTGMDIPTPQPAHLAQPPVSLQSPAQLLGTPVFQASAQRLTINVNATGAASKATVRIHNAGTGVMTWIATTTDRFLVLSPPAGVAAGSDLRCTASDGCPDGSLVITVNPVLLPASRASGVIHLSSPNGGGQQVDIIVEVSAEFSIGAPGTSRTTP
ncbi:MAG: transglycosylase SLT domain-containing protein [Dehalococcoidia bacterium]